MYHPPGLPGDDTVDDGLLLKAGLSEVDAGGLYAFVTHQVGEQGDIVVLLQEILGETVTERVGIDHIRVYPVLGGEGFQLMGHPARGDTLSETVHEEVP